MMYVVGGVDENEVLLYNVILALRDSLHLLFKYARCDIRRNMRLIKGQAIRRQTNDNRELRSGFAGYRRDRG